MSCTRNDFAIPHQAAFRPNSYEILPQPANRNGNYGGPKVRDRSRRLFSPEDPGAVLFAEGSACQSQGLRYSNRDSWDRMLRQGITLLTRFCQDNRVQICQPQHSLQVKFMRQVAGRNDFVASIDAPVKSESIRTEPRGRVVTSSGSARIISWTSTEERFDRSTTRICLP